MSSKYLLPVGQLVVATALIALPATIAWGNDDSSADVSGGYTDYVASTTAAVLKVPINEAGEELVRAAELRTYAGQPLPSSNTSAIKSAFEAAATVSEVPTISQQDVSRDSSTWGWFNWCGNYGYRSNYYNNYYPSYYSYGNYYNYGRPYSYNYYNNYNGGGSYYGYRYYYYPRY